MFEPKFLGQVRVKGMGQASPAAPAAGAPSPASSDARFAPEISQNFFTPPLTPFMVPFVAGWTSYPQGYPPDQYSCVLNADGLSWTCTPRISAPGPVLIGPPYPVPVAIGPFGPFGY
jgi:hypothetical protein